MIDASALVLAVASTGAQADALRDRLPGWRLSAPHLIDAEFGSVIRRHERAGLLSPEQALTTLRATPALIADRYPHTGPVAESAWALRANLTFYDALYVALAEHLRVPLVTADARLANAPGLRCDIELV
ncbi:type II toxin-antitoxin system VapC family toxin [Aldersonia sp. NBC_00410]|uniref:type II toxin-antitoxin system VapC family toxin n=1 Tax=Aldersonia sp. NBC_00410 TaxID=2975954 RepID=UPI002257FCC0|nr:type II toxin-antitoxin system VapC family toxin [Aldersonia sp. NBC_00410]